MVNESEIVAQKIESGAYYSEGMDWFHGKFTMPRSQFTYFFIICIIAVIAFLIALAAFMEIFPLSPGKNFLLSRSFDTGKLTIHSIQKPGETPNDSIMKFMLTQYVKAREEYIEERLDRNFRVVKTFSSKDVYEDYLGEVSINNPNNPVVFYGKEATKYIVINHISLLNSSGHQAHDANVVRAIVNYTTVLTFFSDNSTQTSDYEADITFNYRQITVDQKTGKISEKPEMIINSYKISSQKKS